MATTTNIPVVIPKDGSLNKAMIKDIVSTFLTNEWPNVDPETLVVTYNTGYANTNCVVQRPKPKNGTHSEPLKAFLKAFLKIHGGLDGEIEVFKHLVPTKHEEAQLCYDYAQSGPGAKVYGFFQTQDGSFGRVDEFLDAHTLEAADVEDADIRADVAREKAVFHTLATQRKKNPVQSYYDVLTQELARYYKMDKLKRLANEGGNKTSYRQAGLHRRKKGWCIHDVQFMNVMVKNNSRQGESKVVLIDFEFVFQNYRAFDIGGHFLQKMFKWFDEEDKIADCRPYTEEEKRHFCEEYAKKWNEKTGDSDTGEQVYMESEMGFMLAITFEIHNMLCFMDQDDDKDPLNILGLNKLFEEFVNQYRKLELEI
ncbi:choline/ethanolamine kinase [Penicillium concentricum]|uniref:Choline/ethanolamine kinase n=1 Tax=Penicillium concentricum TaxID=293559 RepID=A0A9W9V9N2_9EURO|nr:choline/ethanolamine kinase [Penicillium concentricum]KAJ5374048.1 choline/ethanolamine kinase [Penicillium concentricum]